MLTAIAGAIAVWVLILAGSARAADVQVGAKIMQERCAKCHGSDGAGDGPDLPKLHILAPPRSWHNKVAMAKWSDQELIDMIDNGGKAAGYSPAMPAFRGKLTDVQVQDLLAYIRSRAK